MLADQGIGVGGVTDDESFAVASGVVVDRFTNIDKDLPLSLRRSALSMPGPRGLAPTRKL